MKKVKVVQFIHGLNMGGAETLVKEYALRIDKKKFDVTVLCYERLDSPYYKMIDEAGIEIIYACDDLPLWGKKNILAKLINHFGLYFVLRKYLRKLKPDVVHSHLCLNKYLKFARLPKNTKLFYTQHFDVLKWYKSFFRDVKVTKQLIKKYSMTIIALNPEMKNVMVKLLGDKYCNNIVVLNNGIDVEEYQKNRNKGEIRKSLGISFDSFVVGHVGRLSKVKNHDYIIDVFRKIRNIESDAVLLIVGSGEEKNRILYRARQYALEDAIIILSNRMDVPNLLCAMDVMVFPSFSEGVPITLIEAQVAGVRCIVSDTITKEIEISNLIEFRNIEELPSVWANEALKLKIKAEEIVYKDLDKWNMRNIIKRLENYYIGENI